MPASRRADMNDSALKAAKTSDRNTQRNWFMRPPSEAQFDVAMVK